MQIKYGLTVKLTLVVISTSALILAIVFAYNYILSQKVLLESNDNLVNTQIEKVALTIDSVVLSVEQFPISVSNAHEEGKLNIDVLRDIIPVAIDSNEKIYGSTIAFEPYTYDKNLEGYAPYFYAKEDGSVAETSLATREYDYLNQPWYSEPKKAKKPVWSEPYFDKGGGNVLMVTYSVPLFKENKFTAVVTADIALDWLQRFIRTVRIGEHGYVFIMSRGGIILAHHDPNMIMKEFNKYYEGNLLNKISGSTDKNTNDIINHEIEFDPYVQGPAILRFWQHDMTGWIIGIVFSEDEMTAGIRSINRDIWVMGFTGLLVLVGVLFYLSHRITKPMRKLADSTIPLGHGELDADLPQIKTRDEIGILAHSISAMRDNLKTYINKLTDEVAAREKVENELEIAHDIQMNMVPGDFPLFQESLGVDLYAHLIPARGVGGDLYDAFSIDDETIFFSVGDVSGKGIPAALMMARTVTLMRSLVKQGAELNVMLEEVNEELSRNNESCMFVTLICGSLNCRTGNLKYANAGHNFPVYVNTDGNSRFVESDSSLPLAIMEDTRYEIREMNFLHGDKLILYSDGVTEAFNSERKQFGDESLLKSAELDSSKTSQYIVDKIISDVKDHAGEAEQSDDIVVLSMRWLGMSGVTKTIKVKNDTGEYPGVLIELQDFCKKRQYTPETIGRLQLILEESLTNVQKYAYPGDVDGIIEVLFKADNEWFTLTIIDNGNEFNPLQNEFDESKEFEKREQGGMGIVLIRGLADKIEYDYRDGFNRLEMRVRIN